MGGSRLVNALTCTDRERVPKRSLSQSVQVINP
jgi:hypothetical protein